MSRAVIGVLVCLSLSGAACSRESAAQAREKDEARAKPVETSSVAADQVRRTIDIVGTLSAIEEATISSEVDAKVSRIRADLGDHVSAGEVLIELDREKLEYGYEASRAAVARARAKYGVGDDGRTLRPIEMTPDVQKAAADLAQAEQAATRARELSRRGLVARQQLDDAEAHYQSTKAQYDAAVQNAHNLRADIDAGEANMRLAERSLKDSLIRAPFDGYVQKRLVSPGMFVAVQTPVMTLVKMNPLKLTGEVPERMAPWVRVGQKVEIRVDAFPDRVLPGSISRISPAVNQQTRAFPLEATVPNGDGALKPGTFARARILSDRVDRVIAVPVSSLQYRYGVNRVFVVQGDRLVAREVKLGDRLGDRMEVTSGVQAGERIAVADVDSLADGVRVSPTAADQR